jgi:hypothetical protein
VSGGPGASSEASATELSPVPASVDEASGDEKASAEVEPSCEASPGAPLSAGGGGGPALSSPLHASVATPALRRKRLTIANREGHREGESVDRSIRGRSS